MSTNRTLDLSFNRRSLDWKTLQENSPESKTKNKKINNLNSSKNLDLMESLKEWNFPKKSNHEPRLIVWGPYYNQNKTKINVSSNLNLNNQRSICLSTKREGENAENNINKRTKKLIHSSAIELQRMKSNQNSINLTYLKPEEYLISPINQELNHNYYCYSNYQLFDPTPHHDEILPNLNQSIPFSHHSNVWSNEWHLTFNQFRNQNQF